MFGKKPQFLEISDFINKANELNEVHKIKDSKNITDSTSYSSDDIINESINIQLENKPKTKKIKDNKYDGYEIPWLL